MKESRQSFIYRLSSELLSHVRRTVRASYAVGKTYFSLPKMSRAVLGTTQPPIQSVSGFFPLTKAAGASINKVKNEWKFTFSPTLCFDGMVI